MGGRVFQRPGELVPTVEVLDPMVLSSKVKEGSDVAGGETVTMQIPAAIAALFDEELVLGGNQRLFVTLGQFSIVRLERDSQLLVPVYDYCMPEKECSCGSTDDPCSLFRNITFPVGEFFPPNTVSLPENYEEAKNFCACCRK